MERKYYVLYSKLKEKLRSGEYRQGERMPSKRVLADRYGCSLITVERAYEMLAEEGYVIARERRGYFANVPDPMPGAAYTAAPDYLDEPEAVREDFEYSVWFKTVRRVLSEQGSRLFQKAPGAGCAVLRNALADYLRQYRGMSVSPVQIVIGSGAEQLYEIVVKLLGRSKVYGIEEPSYAGIRAAYRGMGAKVKPLPLGGDGIRSECLWQGGFSVLHVTPFHSYPTGITTPIGKRMEDLRWAREQNGMIVEDDFDSEFFLPGNPVETLYALDTEGRVIYVNTFSKSLSPAMRIGYMILPETLLPVYRDRLGALSCSVPVMDQYFLAEFIANGSFERHLNRIRRKMKKS